MTHTHTHSHSKVLDSVRLAPRLPVEQNDSAENFSQCAFGWGWNRSFCACMNILLLLLLLSLAWLQLLGPAPWFPSWHLCSYCRCCTIKWLSVSCEHFYWEEMPLHLQGLIDVASWEWEGGFYMMKHLQNWEWLAQAFQNTDAHCYKCSSEPQTAFQAQWAVIMSLCLPQVHCWWIDSAVKAQLNRARAISAFTKSFTFGCLDLGYHSGLLWNTIKTLVSVSSQVHGEDTPRPSVSLHHCQPGSSLTTTG